MDIAGWNAMYRSGERGKEDAPTILLVETLPQLSVGVALDLACGAGRNAIYLAEQGWTVTAIDGSEEAIDLLQHRSAARGVRISTQISDLCDPTFKLPEEAFDLVLIAYYLQRDLFPKAKRAVRPGGTLIAIVHTPQPGEPWNLKHAKPGELRSFFEDWSIQWQYEGPSRDSAHKRPVAEIVARQPFESGVIRTS